MKETLKVLTQAFIGESQARNRYTFYSSTARKEGLIQIADIFALTADQEKEHANWLFKMIQDIKGEDNAIEVPASASFTLGDTKANLKAALDGEIYERDTMYPDFAKIAKEEGLDAIANRLEQIVIAEAHHAERYKKLLTVLEDGTIFKKDKPVIWTCKECGYVFIGTEPPMTCPCCGHPQGYYYIANEEF